MKIETQLILMNNPKLYQYLTENAYWVKYLNRDALTIKEMEEEMKIKYKMTSKDRVLQLSQSLNMINSFISVLK